jgi:hypothetical protein
MIYNIRGIKIQINSKYKMYLINTILVLQIMLIFKHSFSNWNIQNQKFNQTVLLGSLFFCKDKVGLYMIQTWILENIIFVVYIVLQLFHVVYSYLKTYSIKD